jgi:small-conductance mechanosensitive channel
MTVHGDGGKLSDLERRILRDIEREMEASDLAFVTIFRRSFDPVKRLALAAVLVAAGALVALATFPVSLAAATTGLATMGAGIGVGLDPVRSGIGSRLARCTQWVKAEDVA